MIRVPKKCIPDGLTAADRQQLNDILSNERYLAEIKRIRKERKISTAYGRKARRSSVKNLSNPKLQKEYRAFRNLINDADIRNLRRILGVSRQWNEFIEFHLLNNETGLYKVSPREGFDLQTKMDFENDETRVFIEIFKNTTLKSIQTNWPSIRKAQKQIKDGGRRFRIRKNYGRDRTVAAKKRKGKSAGTIYNEMETFPTGNTDVLPEALRKASHRLKKRTRANS